MFLFYQNNDFLNMIYVLIIYQKHVFVCFVWLCWDLVMDCLFVEVVVLDRDILCRFPFEFSAILFGKTDCYFPLKFW